MYNTGGETAPRINYGYIPTYDVLNYAVPEDTEEVVIYCDVKNGLYNAYYEEPIKAIVDNYRKTKILDCGIVDGLLRVIKHHNKWNKARRDGKHSLKFVFFFESGKSSYHMRLNKNYKAGRKMTDFTNSILTEDDYNVFNKLLRINLDVFDKVANAVPNCYCFYLKHTDADFVPHYLIKKKGLADNPKSLHLIYSTDKDMCQMLDKPNIFQYIRKRLKSDVLYESGEVKKEKGSIDHTFVGMTDANKLFWKFKGDDNFSPEISSTFLSVLGDAVDGIKGIHGIGPARCETLFKMLWEKDYKDIHDVYSFIKSVQDLVNKEPKNKVIKLLEKVLEHTDELILAWKQIDFDEIIRNLDINNIDRIEQVFDKNYVKEIDNTKDLRTFITRTIGTNTDLL